MLNKQTKKKITFFLAVRFGWLFLLALGKTLFVKEKGRHYINWVKAKKANYIYVLWHGRIVVPIYVHRYEGICPMVSQHADGEMIAVTMEKLGYRTVRGSSTRGGKKAFHDMVTRIKQGMVGAMIPDGPRGPRHDLKPGTLYLAQQTGAYLIPATFSSNRKIIFKSWDKFFLPLPFSKNILLYGEPITVPKNTTPREMVKIRSKFEQQMIKLEQRADEYFRK
ncbi:MAG: lysophospholipid acyltransferase family protein [bacterium]|nr:lysophospholipid acyltransferase family protein [bacterium]